MKVTDNSTYRLMQSNLNRITTDMLTLRMQGSTGLKLNRPSDDPGAIRPVLTTRTQLQQNERFLETMGQAGDKMAATDSYLAQIENTLVRAKELAINAINGSLSNQDLGTIADQISELRNQLLDSANAKVDGKYIFAGYEEDTIPFTANPDYQADLYDPADMSTWPYLYHGDTNPTELEITPGEYLTSNLTGRELFFGIANDRADAIPFQGQTVVAGPLTPGTVIGDVTITPEGGSSYTIPEADLNSSDGINYAGNLATLFSQAGTGLTATAQPATANLGDLGGLGGLAVGDFYTLEITAADDTPGGDTATISLTAPAAPAVLALSDLPAAFVAAGATASNATSGTLANGVGYDISSGSLVLTGPANGADVTLVETVFDGIGTTTPAPSIIAGGDQTVYGTVSIAPNSTTAVAVTGDGLDDLGLEETTLAGATRIDLFAVLTRLEEAVRAGNVGDSSEAGGSIQAQLANIDIAADQNRGLRSALGARAERVETAIGHQEDARIDLEQILSRYQDADMIEIFNDIVQKETAFQAALNITGRVSQISILDYF